MCQTWRMQSCCTCMAASGARSLVFIDAVTADKSIKLISEMYAAILPVHIQTNGTKLTKQHFTVQMKNEPIRTVEATQDFLKAKKLNIFQVPNKSPDLSFSFTEDKTEGRKVHKQVATEGSCSEGLAKYIWGKL